MKVLALDYGSARTGVAVSDPGGTLASPREPILRVGTPDGLASLLAIVHAEAPDLILVGLPLAADGREGRQASATRAFIGRLRTRCQVPIETEDERFTSRLARRARSTGATAPEDSVAAAVLLQGYLDRHGGRAAPPS